MKTLVEEYSKYFQISFQSMLDDIENNRVHSIPHRINGMHAKLRELGTATENAMREALKADAEEIEKEFGV